MVTMRATFAGLRDAATSRSSPTFTVPEATVPEKPRKSRFGRFTHWTGKRSGFCVRSVATSIVSRYGTSCGPVYQGICGLGVSMLSPRSADTGIATSVSKPKSLAKARYSASIVAKVSAL